jgi:hypothetical protein
MQGASPVFIYAAELLQTSGPAEAGWLWFQVNKEK